MRTVPVRGAWAVLPREVGQRAPEPGRELEAMGGTERDADLLASGHVIDDEVAVGRQRVEARRRARWTEAVAQQLPHEQRQPVFHASVGLERPRVGIGLRPATVLRGLDRVEMAVDRKAVVARVVHPDPHREAPGLQIGVVAREVRHLLAGHRERDRVAERREQPVDPCVRTDDDAAGAQCAGGRDHVDLAVTGRRHALNRCHRSQLGAVRRRQPLQHSGRTAGGHDAGVRRVDRLDVAVDRSAATERRPPAPDLGGVQHLVRHADRVEAGPVRRRSDRRRGGKMSIPPVRVTSCSSASFSTTCHAS